jgi:hypothetical protein
MKFEAIFPILLTICVIHILLSSIGISWCLGNCAFIVTVLLLRLWLEWFCHECIPLWKTGRSSNEVHIHQSDVWLSDRTQMQMVGNILTAVLAVSTMTFNLIYAFMFCFVFYFFNPNLSPEIWDKEKVLNF